MLTIRSLFLGLNFWSTKKINQETRKPRTETNLSIIPGFLASRLINPMSIELFVRFPTLLINLSEATRHNAMTRFVGLERCRSCHLIVPMLGPDTVGVS